MGSNALWPRLTGRGTAAPTERGWKLRIPPGDESIYRLAQVDDYAQLARRRLRWQPGAIVRLRARVSALGLPGTWGFGLWNNPFGLAWGPTKETRLPALPQAAWFFSASPRSYLSLHDDKPANGFLAQVYRSEPIGTWILPAALTFPFSRRVARRRLSRRLESDAAIVTEDPRGWHTYQIEWNEASTAFLVDERVVLRTGISPSAPLGLIVWIDNQFASFDPQGRLAWGNESYPTDSWLEIEDVAFSRSTASAQG